MLRAGGWQWSKAKLMLSRKRERKEERVRERLHSSRTQLCVRRFIHPRVQTRTDSYTRCLEISQFLLFFLVGGQQSWERTELQPCKMNSISKIRHFLPFSCDDAQANYLIRVMFFSTILALNVLTVHGEYIGSTGGHLRLIEDQGRITCWVTHQTGLKRK